MTPPEQDYSRRFVAPRVYPRSRAVALTAMFGLLFAASLAVSAQGQMVKDDPATPVIESGQPVEANLQNGTGDGRASVTVDPMGHFRTLQFDPPGKAPAASTTFFSAVYFGVPGVGKEAGPQGGGGVFLTRAIDLNVEFAEVTASRAVSRFQTGGLTFDLVQEMLPASSTGSTLRQTYTITSPVDSLAGGAGAFDLIRFFDGDLQFDQSIDDIGVVAPGGQQLYELDSNDDPEDPTTFVGIDLNGAANLGFRLAEFSFSSVLLAEGRGVLNNTLTQDGPDGANGVNADKNGDGITDEAYDVILNMGRTISLQPGQRVVFVTNTVLGSGAPGDIFAAPSNLTAEIEGARNVRLNWQDNTNNETRFQVERRQGAGAFSVLGTANANRTTLLDNQTRANTEYTYRVRALRPSPQGPTGFSNEATITTPKGNQQNRPPRFLNPSPPDGKRFLADIGQRVHFSLFVEDPDGDPVRLSLEGLPPGADVSPDLPATATTFEASFDWTPQKGDEGIYQLEFTARDDVAVPAGGGGRHVTRRTYRILVGEVGVCVEGAAGQGKEIVLDGRVGYPHGRKKFVQQMTVRWPRRKLTLKSTKVTELQIRGNTAVVAGMARINGRGPRPFRLIVEENGSRPLDRVVTLNVDGRAWPTGNLRSGEGVDFHLE